LVGNLSADEFVEKLSENGGVLDRLAERLKGYISLKVDGKTVVEADHREPPKP
jgi:hypothetical protein